MDTTILLDTAVLLQEFFHRFPAYARQQVQSPESAKALLDYREVVHLAIVDLAEVKGVGIAIGLPALHRYASVLSDLNVPSAIVWEEVKHWQQNARLLPYTPEDLEVDMEGVYAVSASGDVFPDLHFISALARRNSIGYALVLTNRGFPVVNEVIFLLPQEIASLSF